MNNINYLYRTIMNDNEAIIIKVKFLNGYNSEYKYNLNTKYGRIKEDLFLSPNNNILNRDRFGLKFDHYVNLNTENKLEHQRLSELDMNSSKIYYLTIYDKGYSTSSYNNKIYKVLISGIIMISFTLFFGITIHITLWLSYLLFKFYKLINDPNNYTKKQKSNTNRLIKNGIYNWSSTILLCYDIYFTNIIYSPYIMFFNISAIIILYNIYDFFINNNNKNKLKLLYLEILFLGVVSLSTLSLFYFLYSLINIWDSIKDIYYSKNNTNNRVLQK